MVNLIVKRDCRGHFVEHEGVRYEGTWLGFDAGATVQARPYGNRHGRFLRVSWRGSVGGDGRPGVVWAAAACQRGHDDRQRATCGGCGRSWCDRCDPAPSALCHWCHGRGRSTAPLRSVRFSSRTG